MGKPNCYDESLGVGPDEAIFLNGGILNAEHQLQFTMEGQ